MKIMVIVNPRSKRGSDGHLQSSLKEGLRKSHAEISKTAYPGHATQIAQRAVRRGFDTVVAVGGDGTVNEVLNGIVGSEVALGVIPTGTANDLASHYRIPGDLNQACEVVRRRRVHRTDVLSVNQRYYLTAGGTGLPCDVASIANSIKSHGAAGRLLGRILSTRLYLVAALWAVAVRPRLHNPLEIHCLGQSFAADTLSLTISNQPFLGGRFMVSPSAADDDGRFDVCLISNSKNRAQILSILLRVLSGTHTHSPSVLSWKARELVVSAQQPLGFFGDGEVIQTASKFRIQILPGALNLIVPEAGE
jgi:diacylglycerol kinase (ATP)